MRRKSTTSVGTILFATFIVSVCVIWLIVEIIRPNNISNSFRNDGYLGNMLFYDTLKNLSYDVDYELKQITSSKHEGLIILNAASNVALEEYVIEDIIKHARDGGKILVLLNDSEYFESFTDRLGIEIGNKSQEIPFDKWIFDSGGVFMLGNINILSNLSISENKEVGYKALQMMHPYMVIDGVVFNEFYLFQIEGSNSLWDIIPRGIKYVIYQLIILMGVGFWIKGKRFGQPRKLYEEVEYSENAYTISIGGLFYRAGHWEELVVTYFEDFLNKLNANFFIYGKVNLDTFTKLYQEGAKRDYKRAIDIQKFMQRYYDDLNRTSSKQLSKNKLKRRSKNILITIQKLEQKIGNKEEKNGLK